MKVSDDGFKCRRDQFGGDRQRCRNDSVVGCLSQNLDETSLIGRSGSPKACEYKGNI